MPCNSTTFLPQFIIELRTPWLLMLFVFIAAVGQCQNDSVAAETRQAVFGARVHSGFIFAHSIHVENTKGAKPSGFELEYAHLNASPEIFNRYKCAAKSGWLFSYIALDRQFLGSSYSLSYFLEPVYRVSDALSLHIRGAMGASYLTNPFDSVKNPANHTYSLPVNFFLELGVGAEYAVGKHLTINGGANFFHNSNGGFSQPNAGLNYPNISLGVNYYAVGNQLPRYRKIKQTDWKQLPVRWDAGIFYSPKSGYNAQWQSQRKLLGGFTVQASKQVSSMDNINLATEVFYDGAMASIKNNLGDPSSSVRAGIMIGHDFIFNKFLFGQQLGVYAFKQTGYYNRIYNDDYRTLYHRWGLRYAFTPHVYAGISLLAHAQVADFIDARVFYRF